MSRTMVPRVLGLDTDSHGFHWVASPHTFPESDMYVGSVVVKNDNVDLRRARFAFEAHELFTFHVQPGTHIFCEEPLALQNGKTTRLLGLAAGAIYGAFAISDLDATWHWVDSAHWKKQVLGRGTPPKEFEYTPKAKRVKAWIREESMKLPGFVLDHAEDESFEQNWNLYDAFCIKTYGVRTVVKEGW